MKSRRNEIRVADPKQVIRIPFEFEGDEVTFDRTFTGTGMIRRVVGRRVAKGELVIDVMKVLEQLAGRCAYATSGRARAMSQAIHAKRSGFWIETKEAGDAASD